MESVESLKASRSFSHILTSKSATLQSLRGLTSHSVVSEQVNFKYSDWLEHQADCLSKIAAVFVDCYLIIRSSHSNEDQHDNTAAGQYHTAKKVRADSVDLIIAAVDRVFGSYPDDVSKYQQVVFIQKYLEDFTMVGVIMTKSLISGAPYDHINYHDDTSDSSAVTAGKLGGLKHHISLKSMRTSELKLPAFIALIKTAARELERITECDQLDIEFAVDDKGKCHVFQVRKAVHSNQSNSIDANLLTASLKQISNQIKASSECSSVLGEATIYGVMPDWNPAEIIGTKPRPLAYSIYHFILLENTWAQQRYAFGYRDLRGHSLLLSFAGCPYIDVRLSLNSLVPKKLKQNTAQVIINAYLSHLRNNPELHDKIEFDVALTAFTPGFDKKAKINLLPYGVAQQDINALADELKQITARTLIKSDQLLSGFSGFIRERGVIINSEMNSLNRALTLLESARNKGALAFAHAARSAFIAMNMLQDMVNEGMMEMQHYNQFLNSIDTITAYFKKDFHADNQTGLVKKYGHLRPGTYDIVSEAYWENPDFYLSADAADKNMQHTKTSAETAFELTEESSSSIASWLSESFKGTVAADITVAQFLRFCRLAIQKRELLKFDLSKNISLALDEIRVWGRDIGLDRERLSFLTTEDLFQISKDPHSATEINQKVTERKAHFNLTQVIELPQLITRPNDVFAFSNQSNVANYITSKKITAPLLKNWQLKQDLSGSVILLEQADPGFDWIFNHDIKGLITAFGGANSHMAIRTAELNIAACIGVGKKTYETLCACKAVVLNCNAKILIPIK